MLRKFGLFLIVLLITLPARAQENVPPAYLLTGVAMVYQNINRCSAAAFTMQLSYFVEDPVYYETIIQRMNPNSQDVSVRIEEMVTIAKDNYGLSGIVRRGGTLELLKQLVSNGFPVLVENSYFDGADTYRDWMSHNRVVVGYDDSVQTVLVFDSLLGNGTGTGRPMAYDDFMQRWLAFNYDYLVLYKPEDEAKVQAILGDMWDVEKNAAYVIKRSEQDLQVPKTPTDQAYALMNQAWAYNVLGNYERAVLFYEQALTLPLPWRYFWYDFGIFEAYIGAERYEQAIDLAVLTLASTSGVEELYYYIGLAAERMGDTARAKANYETALFYNSFYTEAQQALARVSSL